MPILCGMYNVCCIDPMQDGRTALIRAATHGHKDIVKFLIEETTAQVDATNYVSKDGVYCTCFDKHMYMWYEKTGSVLESEKRF